jgi:hypothetical protein
MQRDGGKIVLDVRTVVHGPCARGPAQLWSGDGRARQVHVRGFLHFNREPGRRLEYAHLDPWLPVLEGVELADIEPGSFLIQIHSAPHVTMKPHGESV